MNDIERAIEFLKNFLKANLSLGRTNGKYKLAQMTHENFSLAIAALEKQKSKKPKEQEINNSGDLIGLCSVCRKRWVNKYQKYCAECGTRLDWSVEE